MKRIALTTGRLGGVTVAETNPEAPTPCVNCGSPECEWPGECGERISEDKNHDEPNRPDLARAIRDRLVVK